METIIQWLKTFPGWEDTLYIDHTEAVTGNAGLFPMGIRVLERRCDILGNEQLRLRSSFQLRRVTSHGQENLPHAQWLLELQAWVMEQSRLEAAPVLGANTQWSAQNGKLSQSSQPGMGIYTLELTAEYWK